MFDNAEVLGKLDKRGNLITAGVVEKSKTCCSDQKIDPIQEVSKEIEQMVDSDDKKVDKDKRFAFTSPVAAYITFATQEGYERALLYWDEELQLEDIKALVPERPKNYQQILGDFLYVLPGIEPTNILWENLRVPKKLPACTCKSNIRLNKLISTFIVLVFLLCMFWLFLILKRKVAKYQRNYPPTYDCDAYTESFQTNGVMTTSDKNE